MAQPPFPFDLLDAVAGRVLPAVKPVVDPFLAPASRELRHRLVLLLNHVLGQEAEAMARLKRQRGRVLEITWRDLALRLAVTPAGLLDQAPADARPDLTLALIQDSPLELARSALRGDKPDVRIAGDVQLAAEVNWLADHLRWDLEEDLSRLMGDAPAHALATGLRQALSALKGFASRFEAGRTPASAPPAAHAPGGAS